MSDLKLYEVNPGHTFEGAADPTQSEAGAQVDDGLWVDTVDGSNIQWGFNGPWESGSNFYFKSIMDQVRMYDRHLTSREYTTLYNGGVGA